MTTNNVDRRDFVKMGAGMVSAFAFAPSAAALFKPLESDEPLSVAVIGTGKQGRVLLGELQKFDFVNIQAVCDVDDRRLQSAKRRAAKAVAYADYKEMLEKEKGLQAIFLATPSHLHADIACTVLEKGLHLYCEAPIATTVEDARRIARTAAGAKCLFHAGLQLRANPIYKLARSFVRSGAIRDIVSLRGQYNRKTTWRVAASDPARERAFNWKLYKDSSIGLPGEEGIHSFDAVSWFLKKRPVAVDGWGRTMVYRDGREIPDTVQCTIEYPGEVRMDYNATLANSFDGSYQLFTGTMGAIKLIETLGWMFKEADAPTQGWEVYAIRQHFHKEEGITLIADATKLAAQGKLKEGVGLPYPPLYYGVQDFLDGVVNKKTETACPASVGLESAVVAIKAHEAVMTGKKIALEEAWFSIG